MVDGETAAVLRELIAALDDPGGINEGLAEQVRLRLRETLDVLATTDADAPEDEDSATGSSEF